MWELRYNFDAKQYFDDIEAAKLCLSFTRMCGFDGFIYKIKKGKD